VIRASRRNATTPPTRPGARAIRVDRSDLGAGNWRGERSDENDDDAPKECKDPNLSDLVETGEAENSDFSHNGSFVGSGAAVFLNERHAATAWRRLAAQPIARCLIAAFRQGLRSSGITLQVLISHVASTATRVAYRLRR
jgi:hypothetical protein